SSPTAPAASDLVATTPLTSGRSVLTIPRRATSKRRARPTRIRQSPVGDHGQRPATRTEHERGHDRESPQGATNGDEQARATNGGAELSRRRAGARSTARPS